MKIIFISFLVVFSLTSFASDVGNCEIHAISSTSSEDNTPHRFFNVYKGETSLTKCINEFKRDIEYLKSCRVVVGGKIHYIEMEFTITGRTVSTVEPLNVICN